MTQQPLVGLTQTLSASGFDFQSQELFEVRSIKLRDGRIATLYVNREDGHGILDKAYWESDDYYHDQYRAEFSAKVDQSTQPEEHLKIYREVNERQFAMFSKRIDANTKYLEVGCSFGGVIQHVAHSTAAMVHGVEPNRKDAAFVSSRLAKAKIFNSYLEDANLSEKYSIIASFEVLEHARDPHAFVRKLVEHLAPQGFINIEVPNHHDALLYCYEDLGYRDFYYHKAHIHYFTPRSLQALFDRQGIRGEVKGFQMYPFTNQIHWLYNHTPMSSATKALFAPQFNLSKPVNQSLRNYMEQSNRDYAALVAQELVSDCLVFQGRNT